MDEKNTTLAELMKEMENPSSMLTGAQITHLISGLNPPLIENYTLFRQQLQPSGFDLTLAKILEPKSDKPVDFSKAKTEFMDNMQEVDLSQPLTPLAPYVFITREVVNLPLDLTGYCVNRSSLTRLGGILGSGLVDAGFRGTLGFSYINVRSVRFKAGERIAQIIFFKHAKTFAYSGQYQNVLK